jgi:hypothetical protein
MAKDKDVAQALVDTANPLAAEPKATLKLYLLRPWTTGSGHTYPVHAEGDAALEFDFDALPAGVDASAIEYLIASGAAESAAMRSARPKAAKN